MKSPSSWGGRGGSDAVLKYLADRERWESDLLVTNQMKRVVSGKLQIPNTYYCFADCRLFDEASPPFFLC